MLLAKNICKKYLDNRPIINGLSLELKKGEIVCILGKNGTGKTTFLECLIKPHFIDEGKVTYDDLELNGFNTRYKFFYIPSNRDLFANVTCSEYLQFVKKLFKSNVDIEDKILELELEQYMNYKMSMCSYGTKQKVFILAAIVSSADYILMDEPFNGIDVESSLKIIKFLNEMKDNKKGILFTSNQLDYILDIAKKVMFINSNLDKQEYEAENLTMDKMRMLYM